MAPFLSFFRHQQAMAAAFRIARFVIYVTVVLWSIVCLAIAVHFHTVLAATDLTRFVPFVIFVSSASLAIFITLLGFGIRRDRNPITTKIELGFLGLAGTLWLALSALLINSEARHADVECAADDNAEILESPLSSSAYQSQYRALEGFSTWNTIFIWTFLLSLLGLALRQHFQGKTEAWNYPVTTFPWFSQGGKTKAKLPGPVTAEVERSESQRRLTATPADLARWDSYRRPAGEVVLGGRGYTDGTGYTERPSQAKHKRERTRDRHPYRKTTDSNAPVYDKYHRSASPRR